MSPIAINRAIPGPSRRHATCAWCRRDFSTIVDLIDHVDMGHLEATQNDRQPEHAAAPVR